MPCGRERPLKEVLTAQAASLPASMAWEVLCRAMPYHILGSNCGSTPTMLPFMPLRSPQVAALSSNRLLRPVALPPLQWPPPPLLAKILFTRLVGPNESYREISPPKVARLL